MQLLVSIFFFIVCLSSTQCWAIKVDPISAALDLNRLSSHMITVSNETEKAAPVKVSILNWSLDQNGNEVQSETDELLVFPKQFLLQPGEKRKIRVSPRYKKPPSIERAYRVVVEELPVKESKRKGSGVTIVSRFFTAFYVLPEDPYSKVEMKKASRTKEGFTLSLLNSGSAHTHLTDLEMTFTQGGNSITLIDKQSSPINGANLHAQSERVFSWEWPSDLTKKINLNGSYKVILKWKCEYCDEYFDTLEFTPK